MKKIFDVTGMSCNNCVAHVDKAVKSLDGVKKVKVNLKKAEASVKFDESLISDAQIIQAIEEAGYEAVVK